MKVTSVALKELLHRDLSNTTPFLTSDMTPGTAAQCWLQNSLVKKWIPDDTKVVDQVAIQGFLDDNDRCGEWQEPDGSEYVDDILSIAKTMMAKQLEVFPQAGSRLCLHTAVMRGRHGPGASAGTKAKTFYHKSFDGDLSFTNVGLYQFYRSLINPVWGLAEDKRAACHWSRLVSGSEVLTVPKNEDTSRTICKEPSLNMFFQLGFGEQLCDILVECHNIDVSLQPDRNRELARIGSITQKFATIDLKSASNSIANKFVQWFLPRMSYDLLSKVRCDYTYVNGEKIEMKMFSSMGNGFTFPLQTLIFATLVRATYQYLGIKPRVHKDRNYSVFGDDIVCLSDTYHIISKVLTRCGFMINDSKSFHVGHFRESCGADYFKGHDIRGIYIKEIRSESHVYSAFNRLSRWSATHNVYIGSILLYLKGLAVFRPVPFDESDDAGNKTPSCFLTNRQCDANGAQFYRVTVNVQKTVDADDLENPLGAYISALGGYIRNGRLSVETRKKRYKVKRRKTPCWDKLPIAGPQIREYADVFACLTYI